MLGQFNRIVQQWLIGNHTTRFDPARCRNDNLRRAIIDPYRKFVGCKSTKHNCMGRTNPRARQCRDDRFGDHRHI